jgi:hypothetical protein
MKAYKGFESKVMGDFEQLPSGGYVCEIKQAEEIQNQRGGSRLEISVDIAEGDYKGYFANLYKADTREDKKWRGTFRLRLPKDDGSEQDAWKKRSLGNTIWALEQSNPGFSWDWDEKKLKGKKIGLLYRNKEWEMNGRTGWTTEAISAESIDNIREGKFRIPKDKALPVKATTPVFTEEEDDGELPF